ncbi:MAG: DUF29 family protein [Massilia sp.]
MGTPYETDAVAWAREQAALLRRGKLTSIDAFNIAGEIEDVGRSEHRALAGHLAILLAQALSRAPYLCVRKKRIISRLASGPLPSV